LAEAFDRRAPDREGSSDGAISSALSRFEQDAGTSQFAGRVCAVMEPVFELRTVLVAECHEILLLGHDWSSSYRVKNQTIPEAIIIHQRYRDGVLVAS
jgi:hypothetical protein